MKYYIDLAEVNESFYDALGLVEIDEHSFNKVLSAIPDCEVRDYDEFKTVVVKMSSKAPDPTKEGLDSGRLYNAMEAFSKEIKAWEGDEFLCEVYEKFAKATPSQERALLALCLLAFDGQIKSTEELSANDKRMAVEVASQLRPAEAQWLYKFAVLVTKLA